MRQNKNMESVFRVLKKLKNLNHTLSNESSTGVVIEILEA